METSKLSFEERMDLLAKRFEEADKLREKEAAEAAIRMKNLEKHFGGMCNSNGDVAEAYFYNSFENGNANFFGETYDLIMKGVKGKIMQDEYDILLINGKSICIIEIKYTADKNDIPQVIKKAETIKVNMPQFAKHKIYLGLASMAFDKGAEDACKKNGIAIIKEVGENVVINHKHLKEY